MSAIISQNSKIIKISVIIIQNSAIITYTLGKLIMLEWVQLSFKTGFEIRRVLASNTLKSKWGLSTFLL